MNKENPNTDKSQDAFSYDGTPDSLVSFMAQADSEQSWNECCDAVKEYHGGQYPPFWYSTLILSGAAQFIRMAWE